MSDKIQLKGVLKKFVSFFLLIIVNVRINF